VAIPKIIGQNLSEHSALGAETRRCLWPRTLGMGLEVPGDELPNYNVPPFSGIGANEYIVDVTHEGTRPDVSSQT